MSGSKSRSAVVFWCIEVCYLSVEARETLSSETAQVHVAARRRGGLAGRSACAAACNAGDRVPRIKFGAGDRQKPGGIPQRLEPNRIHRGPQRGDRVPLVRRARGSNAGTGGRFRPPTGGGNRGAR